MIILFFFVQKREMCENVSCLAPSVKISGKILFPVSGRQDLSALVLEAASKLNMAKYRLVRGEEGKALFALVFDGGMITLSVVFLLLFTIFSHGPNGFSCSWPFLKGVSLDFPFLIYSFASG